MGDGELGCADWVDEVDVGAGVAVGCWGILGWGFAGWVPEIGEGLLLLLLLLLLGVQSFNLFRIKKPNGGRAHVWLTHRLEDTSTWTYDIRASKFFACNVEHAL